jgi:DNA-binding NarL/FixJ family response regulator
MDRDNINQSGMMITLAIADDEMLFRHGLAALFEQKGGFRTILQASNGETLLNELDPAALPDIILLDIRMKPLNGIDTAKVLKEKYPETKVIILTSFYNHAYLGYMVKLGVNAFLSKNSSLEDLVSAVKTVYHKGLYFSEDDVTHFRKTVGSKPKASTLFNPIALTRREMEVLGLICREYSTPEIAEKLNLSVRTVEGHRNNLFEKTGAKNMVGLVIFALMEKVVNLDDKLIELSMNR